MLNRLLTGSAQHPSIQFENQGSLLGQRNKVCRGNDATIFLRPPHQRLVAHGLAQGKLHNGLVEHLQTIGSDRLPQPRLHSTLLQDTVTQCGIARHDGERFGFWNPGRSGRLLALPDAVHGEAKAAEHAMQHELHHGIHRFQAIVQTFTTDHRQPGHADGSHTGRTRPGVDQGHLADNFTGAQRREDRPRVALAGKDLNRALVDQIGHVADIPFGKDQLPVFQRALLCHLRHAPSPFAGNIRRPTETDKPSPDGLRRLRSKQEGRRP